MEMNHLTDKHWLDWPNSDHTASGHLSQCDNCRNEWNILHNLLNGLASSAQSATQHPEVFWDRQRLSIQRQIATALPTRTRPARLAWAAVLALLLVGSLLLKTGSRVPVQQSAPDSDRELLVQVEQALDGNVPQALQPASLIAYEIDQAAQPQSRSASSKEKSQHEN
jgi:hypothetical protein